MRGQASCELADEQRGGCCNACWARRWAEELRRLLLAKGGAP